MTLEKCGVCGMIGCTCYTKVRVSYRTWTQPAPAPQPPTGWQCPLCRVVHAPSVTACRCAVSGPLNMECPRCTPGFGPCMAPDCMHPLFARAQGGAA